jgi:hypothetical protein
MKQIGRSETPPCLLDFNGIYGVIKIKPLLRMKPTPMTVFVAVSGSFVLLILMSL